MCGLAGLFSHPSQLDTQAGRALYVLLQLPHYFTLLVKFCSFSEWSRHLLARKRGRQCKESVTNMFRFLSLLSEKEMAATPNSIHSWRNFLDRGALADYSPRESQSQTATATNLALASLLHTYQYYLDQIRRVCSLPNIVEQEPAISKKTLLRVILLWMKGH